MYKLTSTCTSRIAITLHVIPHRAEARSKGPCRPSGTWTSLLTRLASDHDSRTLMMLSLGSPMSLHALPCFCVGSTAVEDLIIVADLDLTILYWQ